MRRLVVSRSVGCESGFAAGPRDRLAVRAGRVLPAGADAVVVERRLAVHHQLDGAAHASHGAQQDVLGIPVHRGAAVRARPRLDVVPRPHHQRVAHDQPAGMRLPGGLQDQAAGQVAARGRHRDAVRAQPEVAGAAIQDGPEDAGRVGPRHAHPFHRAGRRDQAGGFAVRQERVVGDRGKRVPQRPARRIRHRGRHGERCGVGLVGGLGVLQNHADIIGCRPARRLLVTAGAPRCWLSGGRTRARARANGPIAMAYPAAVRRAGILLAIRTSSGGLRPTPSPDTATAMTRA